MVRENDAGVADPVEADTVYGPPIVALAVNVDAVAIPEALVAAVVVAVPFANVPDAPEAGAVNVTVWLGTTLPNWSVTSASSALANARPVGAVPGDPEYTDTVVAVPGLLVSAKDAGVADPLVACTDTAPAIVFAMKVTVAMPDALVIPVIVAVLFANVPDAPEAGAVKVTLTPSTGLSATFVTNADSGLANVSPTVADCGEPEKTETVAAGGVFVSVNVAGVADPVEADTL